MKKRLSDLLIFTLVIGLFFSEGLIFQKVFSSCIFAAEAGESQENIATSSVATPSSTIKVMKKHAKKKIFPRFRLSLENEEIICGQKAKVKISGLLETDKLIFWIKEADSSIGEEGKELRFEGFSGEENGILFTDDLKAGSWQLMAAITRENYSISIVCDLITVDKEFISSEKDEVSSQENRKNSSAVSARIKKKKTNADLSMLKISAPYIYEGVWIAEGNNWKLLTNSGSFAANQWAFLGGCWYVFDSNGNMLVGWQNINQNWYFMNKDGTMATGWILDNHKWYFLAQSGEMYVSAVTPDGYLVNSSGEWVEDGIVQTDNG